MKKFNNGMDRDNLTSVQPRGSYFTLENVAISATPKFIMGIDTYDEKALAYCLTKHTEGEFVEVVLAKRMSDRKAFDEEVANLCNYFDATLLK